ncbi:MAG TPA: PGPGW domain-containing protein [Thermoleophilaceae bacterium]
MEGAQESHGSDTGRPEREEETSKVRELFEKLEERREAYAERGLAYRVVWTTAGFTVVLAGAAMLVLPGPALAVIPVGLAMLALQFAWAERLLEIAVDKAEAAGKAAGETSTKQRIAGAIAVALAAAAAVAAAIAWDIPLLPV